MVRCGAGPLAGERIPTPYCHGCEPAGIGISVNAVHPGVVYTKLLRTINPLSRLLRLLLLTPDKGGRRVRRAGDRSAVQGGPGRVLPYW